MKDLLGTLLFALALAFLAFLAGAAVGIFRFFPYDAIYTVYSNAYAVLTDGGEQSSPTGLHHLYPQRYRGVSAMTHQPDKVQPGVTLVTGYWYQEDRWQPAVRLLDEQGETLHEWVVRPEQIWPSSPFSDHAAGRANSADNYVHGVWLLPGGDIIFNVEYAGMARMNACGEVVWTLPYRTHHSLFRDEDGNFWASGLNWRYEKIDAYVHPTPNFVDETLLKVSPDGEILREIFILESMYESGYGGIFADAIKTLDLTHLNDVESLSSAMADAFPMFAAGDLLVSLRNISTVFVLDGETAAIKWHMRHPLVRQHDPDFEPDGTIVIYDNRDDMTQQGMRLGPTRLIKVDPATNDYTQVYPLTDKQAWYSQTGGKHQLLANGNRLITEPHGGRVLEVDSEGELVWDWIIEARELLVPEVLEGSRYPAGMAEFDTSACN